MKAVDLFAGAGGFSLGLSRAGFDVVLANEYSTEPEWTYRANLLVGTAEAEFPEAPQPPTMRARNAHRAEVRDQIRHEREEHFDDLGRHMRGGDIREALTNDWLAAWQAAHGEVDLLVAGPPCQGFSSAGKRDPEDKRNLLVAEALRVIRVLEPKLVIIENVPGLLHRHPDKVAEIGSFLSSPPHAGDRAYKVVVELVAGEALGVPQTRRRLLIIGVREDLVDAGVHARLPGLLFPPLCPSTRFDVDEPGDFVERGEQLAASVILGDLATCPPPYGRKRTPLRQPYRKGAHLRPFTAEIRAPRIDYLAGLLADGQRRQREYANHDASVHADHVSRRMRLLRETAIGSKEGLLNRCSSGWLKGQFMHLHPDLETNKASQRVLVPKEWPALTVTSLPDDIVHFREDRIPTVREVARLQTFPDWFEFKGVRTTGAERRRAGIYVPHYTQVANAVPPRLAHAVAARLRWFLQRVVDQDLRDCDFDLPGGTYESPNTSGTGQALLAMLNARFGELAARREALAGGQTGAKG